MSPKTEPFSSGSTSTGANPPCLAAKRSAVRSARPARNQSTGCDGVPSSSMTTGRWGRGVANQAGGRYTHAERARKCDTTPGIVTSKVTPWLGSRLRRVPDGDVAACSHGRHLLGRHLVRRGRADQRLHRGEVGVVPVDQAGGHERGEGHRHRAQRTLPGSRRGPAGDGDQDREHHGRSPAVGHQRERRDDEVVRGDVGPEARREADRERAEAQHRHAPAQRPPAHGQRQDREGDHHHGGREPPGDQRDAHLATLWAWEFAERLRSGKTKVKPGCRSRDGRLPPWSARGAGLPAGWGQVEVGELEGR